MSFLICMHEQRDFIGRTVESALEQSLSDIEVIVVDDGSTDGGAEVVRAFRDRRLRLIEQPNQGPSAALNNGLQACRGEYVALLGGDDVALRDRARDQIELLERLEVDLVFSVPILIDEQDRRLSEQSYPVFFGEALKRFNSNPLATLFFQSNFLCAPSSFARRKLFEEIGPFTLGLIQLQDFDYWVRAARSGRRLLVSTNPVVRYRRRYRNNNLSSEQNAKRTTFEYCFIMRRFLESCAPELVRQAFRDHLPVHLETTSAGIALANALLFLSHGDPHVRAFGYEQAIELFEMGPEALELAARVGLTPQVVFEQLLGGP